MTSDEHTSTPRDSVASSEERLSRLSNTTKFASVLHQLSHVDISRTYQSGPTTLYVLDIYLQYVQSGIPSRRSSNQSSHDTPVYRLEKRYSDFRELRDQLRSVVGANLEKKHTYFCYYCTRINWIVRSLPFPSRSIADGLITSIRPLQKLRIEMRKKKLVYFLNEIIRCAKDGSYRRGDSPCDGFENVALVVKNFFADASARDSCTGW